MVKIKILSLHFAAIVFLMNPCLILAMEKEKSRSFQAKNFPEGSGIQFDAKRGFYVIQDEYNYDLSQEQVPQDFNHKGVNPKEDFNWNKYREHINKGLHLDQQRRDDAQKNQEAAEQKRIKEEKEYELERIKAGSPTQTSQYATPFIGSKADDAQSENFKAQAEFHRKQANALNYNNTYIFVKDSAQIVAQLIAPSLSPALSPVLLEWRQKYIYKTAAEKDAEKTRNAHEAANLKATEAQELAAIAASLSQGSGRVVSGKGLEEVIEATHLLAQLNLNAAKDLEKRQKETSELYEHLNKK